VRSEDFGVPQRRHRVIIVGIRSDLVAGIEQAKISVPEARRTVEDVIGNLPALRSGLSKGTDTPEGWREVVLDAASLLTGTHTSNTDKEFKRACAALTNLLEKDLPSARSATALPKGY